MKTPLQQIAEYDSFARQYARDAAGHAHDPANGQFTGGGGGAVKSKRTASDSAGRKYTFIPHPNKSKHETTIMVDAAELDKAWKHGTPDLHIPAGGGGGEIAGRRAGVEKFLESGKPVEASRAVIDENGGVDFTDGRHRFSVLRDWGIKKMAITIDKNEVKHARKFLGAE